MKVCIEVLLARRTNSDRENVPPKNRDDFDRFAQLAVVEHLEIYARNHQGREVTPDRVRLTPGSVREIDGAAAALRAVVPVTNLRYVRVLSEAFWNPTFIAHVLVLTFEIANEYLESGPVEEAPPAPPPPVHRSIRRGLT